MAHALSEGLERAAGEQYPLLTSLVETCGNRTEAQMLECLERPQLEELAQELYLILKHSDGKLQALRRQASRGSRVSTGGYRALTQSTARRMPALTGAASRGQHSHSADPIPLTPRNAPAHPANGNRSSNDMPEVFKRLTGISALERKEPGALSPLLVHATNTGSVPEFASEAPATLRSPRSPRSVTEDKAQRIFDRLYDTAKEQRVRRHVYSELGKMSEEARLIETCPFEPQLFDGPPGQLPSKREAATERLYKLAVERRQREQDREVPQEHLFRPTLRTKSDRESDPASAMQATRKLYLEGADRKQRQERREQQEEAWAKQNLFQPNTKKK